MELNNDCNDDIDGRGGDSDVTKMTMIMRIMGNITVSISINISMMTIIIANIIVIMMIINAIIGIISP
jgi:hypothetical protein